jgi:RNA polymerase sigma-54 factor
MLQVQEHSQRPLTTAHLAQTMTLLALSNLELRETIQTELASNPALELIDKRVCPGCRRPLERPGPCPVCSLRNGNDEPVVFLSPRESIRFSKASRLEEDLPDREPAAPEDLSTYVLQQLAAELLPEDRSLAAYVLSSLDEDGFLPDHPAMIARTTRSMPSQVTRVLDLITRADPPGLASEGPRQALLVQLDLLEDMVPNATLARRMLEETFSELGRREYDVIAKRLDASSHSVRQAADFIQQNLNPYPARSYWGSGKQRQSADPNVYHNPDIQISPSSSDDDGPLQVEIFSAHRGWLRVNPLFREAVKQKHESISEDWSQHLERAALFVKCLQQRNQTMRRMMKILVSEQRDFILHGPRHLHPMTRAKLAERLEVHESTVSRAVAHKSVALPDGRIIPLARFFDRSLPIRDTIREIIELEQKPLTDDQIAEKLNDEGIQVARRTVAKYRAMEGILPARLRHKQRSESKSKV